MAVGVGVMLGVGLGWHYSRRWRQATGGNALTHMVDTRALRLVRLALSLRKLSRALTPAEALRLVPVVLDLRGVATPSRAAPNPPSPRVHGLRRWLARIDQLESLRGDPLERARHLVELASQVAPLTPLSERLIRAELLSGGVDAVAAGRDAAVFRLRQFCVRLSISPPHGVMNPFSWARVVAHDAPHLPAVAVTRLQREGFTHWVLSYRPDMLARGGPNRLYAFGNTTAFGFTPLDSREEAAGLSVLGSILSQAMAPLARQWRDRDPIFWARLARPMEAVWGTRGGPNDLPREFVHASAQLLAEVVWGGHVSLGHSDRWGLRQVLSCALAAMPQKTVALRAWLNHEPAAAALLGQAMLEAARLLEHSKRRAGE